MSKLYNLIIILILPALFIIFTSEILYHTGSPGGKTGSPGDMGNNCTECHLGTPINQEFWINSGLLMSEGYEAGETYDILVIAYDGNAAKFGFEATAETSDGVKAGTFESGFLGMTQTINNNKAITHTVAGTTPLADTSTIWMFSWTAPAEPVGDITFYAAINAANGNGNNTGDQIYLSQFTAFPATISNHSAAYQNSLQFFPNPSPGHLNYDLTGTDISEMKVIDLNGRIVKRIMVSEAIGTIDLSGLPKGVYIIQTPVLVSRILLF
jgi:hypothetical protein